MSIETRIQAINDHLIDDYSVLTLAGADLTRVNKNIVNLKMSWKERLLYFMNNGTDEVWNNWDKVSGTGTTLSLNNTEEAPMSLTYKGNTSQTGTPTPSSPIPVQVVSGDNSIVVCGKNLLPITLTSQTKNNVVFTVNSDNSITLNQTSNAGTTINLNYTSGKYISLTSGETYTLSIKNNNGVYVRLAKVSDNSVVASFDSPNKQITFTSNYTGDCFVYLAILNNTSFNNLTIYPMLEKGSTATTYEPYTSNTYSIDLGVENLLNITMTSQTTNGVQFNVNEDKSIWIKGTATARTEPNLWTGSMVLKAGTTYYNNTDTTLYLYANAYYSIGANSSYTPTNDLTLTRVYIRVENGETIDKTIYPMLSTTQTTNYCEYGKAIELNKIGTYQDKIDKSSGKNLLGINNVSSTTVSGITYSISNGVISLSGTANSTSGASIIDIPLLKTIQSSLGTLTKSLNCTGTYTGVQTSLRGQVADTSVGLWSNDASNNTGTISGDAYWFRIQINNGVSVNCTITPQINEGTTALEYEPYGTNWYVKKEIGKVVLNGSENWGAGWNSTNNTNGFVFRNFPSAGGFVSTDAGCRYYSNHFNFSSSTAYYQDKELLYINASNALGMKISKTLAPDLATFKTWLSNNNVEVYYVLATPTYETITDTTLIGQLEALKKSYEGQTNISQTNNDLAFELSVTALEVMS